MKNIKTILSHLKYSPEFKKINTQESIQNLINSLPVHLKNGVKFAYTKNMIMFFVLKHPVFKNEFKNSISLIKGLLKDHKIANIEKIEFFVTHSIDKPQKIDIEKPKYIERSHGIFQNLSKDEFIHKKFENIRKLIKENNEHD